MEPTVLKRTATSVTFAQQQPRLLVTAELDRAIEECRNKVKQISEECRMKNTKFRDLEFDLDHDKFRCLHGVISKKIYKPSDVQRVSQIFEKPIFYAQGGARASDIIQGSLGDCWLMSALATVSTCPGLIEKCCVERDEAVGVYGFIFFKNNTWVNVIVDDLLFTITPKYEELNSREQGLYHYDKDAYNSSARKGGKQLYFAKSGAEGETWVPLLEKAYAKLHGNYGALHSGMHNEAVEDMTGGVSKVITVRDILDTDQFWKDELSRANEDRLFGCSFRALSTESSGRTYKPNEPEVQGLKSAHAHSVLRAVECKGKRFVVIRNPWGKTEWKGPWSDGSKEWQGEWLEVLPTLGHVFGDDGQFIMEYKDFMNTWQDIDRTLLFDDSWIMSSHWLRVSLDPLPNPWRFGDVSFEFSLSAPSSTIIVLSQLDQRYYQLIAGRSKWSMDFTLVKDGEKKCLAVSNYAWFCHRSANLEIDLEAGRYFVFVRIDRYLDNTYSTINSNDSYLRNLSRLMTNKLVSQSIASNLDKGSLDKFTATPVSELIKKAYEAYEKDLKEKELEKKKNELVESESETEDEDSGDESSEEITTTTTTVVVTKKKRSLKYRTPEPAPVPGPVIGGSEVPMHPTSSYADDTYDPVNPDTPAITGGDSNSSNGVKQARPPVNPYNKYLTEDDNVLFLGLKVYTKKEVPVTIVGKLKKDEKKDEKKNEKKDEKKEANKDDKKDTNTENK